MSTTVRRASGLILAILGTSALLILTVSIGQQRGDELSRYFLYQVAGLLVAAVVVAGVVALNGRTHLGRGRLSAPARPIGILGVKADESWLRIGLIFAVIISAVTALFLYLAHHDQIATVTATSWLLALAVAIPLSVTNALTEELVTRWAVVQSLPRSVAAPWVSAAIFGAVHYFGIPGGPAGVLLAGFLGWLLARSIQDTHGIGWAWIIHFCQDVLIFTVTIALFI